MFIEFHNNDGQKLQNLISKLQMCGYEIKSYKINTNSPLEDFNSNVGYLMATNMTLV
jgi:hypothetical protein